MEPEDNRNKIAVIVCAQGADRRLAAILDAVTDGHLPVVVVMSRQTTATADVLSEWQFAHPDRPVRGVITSRRRVLTAGFLEARALHCTHAVTIMAGDDCDPADLPALCAASRAHPSGVVIGYRRDRHSRRSFVHLCNRLLWLQTGLRIRDSQCGQRVYPLRLIDTIDGKHKHYFGHAELLAWAAWAGCPVFETPLTRTPSWKAQRRSYLVQLRYRMREIELHAGLLLRELSGLPYPHYEGGAQRRPFWRGFWQWCNPLRAWRELRRGGATRGEMAAAVAAGVFIGNLPAYGFQTILALYAARRLHLNPVAVVAGTQVSTPPLGPALNLAGAWLGHLLIHGQRLPLAELNPFRHGFLARALPFLLDWTVGSVVLGTATGIIAFVAAKLLFGLVEQAGAEPDDDACEKMGEGRGAVLSSRTAP
ncbi:MAG TPA: DUF2062 domain-containing protein [Tepidisphaeraceae bacterium]|jgi:uncharacterized protein (DUF2062 family)|nr:DUF2062 domain-containing protein [Tepidisphaeraceae bacterium]